MEGYTSEEFAALTNGDFRRAFARLRMKSTLFTRQRLRAGGEQMTVALEKGGFRIRQIVADGETVGPVEEIIQEGEYLRLLRRMEEWLQKGRKLRLIGFTPEQGG